MAGRPRKAVQTIEALEAQAMDLMIDVMLACPERVNGEIRPNDISARGWRVLVNLCINVTTFIEVMGNAYREKAKITRPGPIQEFVDFMETPENEPETADSGP